MYRVLSMNYNYLAIGMKWSTISNGGVPSATSASSNLIIIWLISLSEGVKYFCKFWKFSEESL